MLYLGNVRRNRIPKCKILFEKEVETKHRNTIKNVIAYIDLAYIYCHKSCQKSFKL